MLHQTYKKWHIFYDYQHLSSNYEKINRFVIWTPNMLDMVAEEFDTFDEAKLWVDDNESTWINYNQGSSQ